MIKICEMLNVKVSVAFLYFIPSCVLSLGKETLISVGPPCKNKGEIEKLNKIKSTKTFYEGIWRIPKH